MSDLDDKIREALNKEDAELFENFGSEVSVYEMLMETFRGRHRWLSILGVFWGIVFMVLGVLSGINFFKAEATRDIVVWASATAFCLMAVSMMKIWYWMELNKNAVTREVKRLELQIARLAARLKD